MIVLFGAGQQGGTSLGQGWSDQEVHNVWATGPRSTLVLPRLPVSPYGHVMTLSVEPYAPPGRPQALAVSCNGVPLGEFELEPNRPLVARLAPELVAGSGRTELVFTPRHHVSPAALGLSEDGRELSFALHAISFSADGREADEIEPPVDGLDDRALMMGFESLGDDCEFGFAQRAAGAEPLSLMRFGGILSHRLHEALDTRFAGIDDPANIAVRGGPGEYMVHQTHYRYAYHTFVDSETMSPQELLARELKRLSFCRRKLLEDLEDGDKVFVVKSSVNPGLHLDQVAPIAEAVAGYGGGVVFWARLADDRHPAGQLRWHGPNLISGRIDRLCAPGAAVVFSPFWLPLCRRVYRAVAMRKQGMPVG